MNLRLSEYSLGRRPRTGGRLSLTTGMLALLAIALGFATADSPVLEAAYPGQNGRLLFSSERDGNDEFYSIEADGSDLLRLTNHPLTDEGGSWSPDGTKIAFSRNVGGGDYKDG